MGERALAIGLLLCGLCSAVHIPLAYSVLVSLCSLFEASSEGEGAICRYDKAVLLLAPDDHVVKSEKKY